jgi:hypothetical protein
MRKPPFEGSAPKRTVSLRRRAKLAAEIERDITAAESYAESHGSFADLVREHYERDDTALTYS